MELAIVESTGHFICGLLAVLTVVASSQLSPSVSTLLLPCGLSLHSVLSQERDRLTVLQRSADIPENHWAEPPELPVAKEEELPTSRT